MRWVTSSASNSPPSSLWSDTPSLHKEREDKRSAVRGELHAQTGLPDKLCAKKAYPMVTWQNEIELDSTRYKRGLAVFPVTDFRSV